MLGAPGSAWLIDLKSKNVPVDRIEFDVANSEFVRDVEIQVETLSDYLDSRCLLRCMHRANYMAAQSGRVEKVDGDRL